SIDLNLIEKFERGQWTLSGEGLTDSTVTSELGLTGITDVNRRHTAGTITTGYQFQQTERLSWQLQGAWQTTRYTDAAHFGLTDYEYLSAQFGPSWNLTELITGSLMLGADRIKPDAGPQQKDYSASLQLKRSFSEQYSWRVTAGETRVESGSGSQGDGNSLLVDIGATRQGERVSWDAELRRSVAPIGLGLLAQEDYVALSAAISTTERGTLNLAFNLIRTKPVTYFGYVIYSGASWGQISAEWQHHLSSHWILSIGYLQARARNNDSVWANGGQARLGILWQSGRL
ncbi:MAG TPA: hypothetical protein VL994_04835, partial [Steroidobacteraceae bacterium]|nr:hypothetical protein [Steroidobacteraceae bacterium]